MGLLHLRAMVRQYSPRVRYSGRTKKKPTGLPAPGPDYRPQLLAMAQEVGLSVPGLVFVLGYSPRHFAAVMQGKASLTQIHMYFHRQTLEAYKAGPPLGRFKPRLTSLRAIRF